MRLHDIQLDDFTHPVIVTLTAGFHYNIDII